MLELIFLKVINMSWGAGIVILIVCLARFLLKRFPKYISYMLWSVVLFRLFCPMILEVDISPVRNIEPILYEYTVEEEIVLPETIVEYNDPDIAPETVTDPEDGQTAYEPIVLEENSKEEKRSWQEWAVLVGQYVWILGMSVMFLRFGISFVQMRKKVSTAIPVKDNIYITDEILSPFVMGILRPRIYLSGELSEKEQEYIILHEKFHIRRCDHIIKVIAYVALCIHWFNPLVWLSYVLFCKDMEMSCDEAVIKKMGEGIRADYSASLLALATRHQIIGIPVDFGEGDTKGRIKNLARFRKIKPAVIVVLVIGVVILIVFLAFNNKSSISDVNGLNDESDIAQNEEETNLYNEYQTKKSAINYYKIKDGVLYGRGRNTEGQLGLGKIEPLGVEYNYDVEIAKNVIHVDASNNGTVVYITENGELYGIGNNCSGQLGQSIEGKNRLSDEVNISTPVLIATEVRYALVGINFTMYLTEDDKLYVLGDNANGQLGNGEAKPVMAGRYTSDTTPYSTEPVLVMENVRYIDCGLYNLAAITQRGDLYMWGDNSFGEMGNGRVGNKMPTASIDVVSEPYLVMKNIRKVTIEEFTVYAETMQGEVYTWGDSVTLPKKIEENNGESSSVEKEEELNKINEDEPLNLKINIGDFYLKKTGDPANFYYIDEENVLWGSGRNEYGQLGQGTQDSEFHEEAVKMAENIVHVTFSQKGFVIYLTEDNKLYGVGNAGCGALQQYAEFDWNKYVNVNAEHYSIATPVLLMEDVVYACCGKDDVVCMKKDGTVWTWGTVYVQGNAFSHNAYYIQKPKQILENAVLVTGGWFNHAALLQDGTVWTWGYNISGNCGVANSSVVKEPTMVAKDVVMVWTDLAATLESPPDGTIRAGKTQYNVDYDSIIEFNGEYPYFLNNTVIKKTDGSYWICGENVGTEEKVVHGAEADYTVICTHEFQPYELSANK